MYIFDGIDELIMLCLCDFKAVYVKIPLNSLIVCMLF